MPSIVILNEAPPPVTVPPEVYVPYALPSTVVVNASSEYNWNVVSLTLLE